KVSQDDTQDYLYPAWSTNATGTQKIAFTHYSVSSEPYTEQLYTMNTDGSNEAVVPGQPARDNNEAVWDPINSERLYFHSILYGYSYIDGINTDGTNLIQVASPGNQDPESPTISADGSTVVYSLYDDLYEAPTNGTGSQTDLTSGSGYDNLYPSFV